MDEFEPDVARRLRAGERTLPAPLLVAFLVLVIGLIIAFVFGIARYMQSLPAIAPVTTFPTELPAAPLPGTFPWPQQGQAAIAVDGLGVVATHGLDAGPQPMASTTKIMTALLILEHHPLKAGEQGPIITLTQADADNYQQDILQDESAVWVQAGEQISERQLLEGLLLPSANNFAEILAKWDAGSQAAFVDSMNAKAQALGMRQTHFDDSSGFSPKTVSTATDMLALAQAAMQEPAFVGIVKTKTASLPLVNDVHNSNLLLGNDDVVGIKTGSSDQAGGCLVIAADVADSAGAKHRVYAVVMGVQEKFDSLENVFPATQQMLDAIPKWLVARRVVAAGQSVGSYAAPWGGKLTAVAAKDVDVTTWAGTQVTGAATLDTIHAPIGQSSKVGELTVQSGGKSQTVDVVSANGMQSPGIGWRLFRN